MKKAIPSDDVERVQALLRKVLNTDADATLTRLGGLTNRTYRADLPNGNAYIVRIPGEGTQEIIDRTAERTSTMLANRLEIDAQVLYFDTNGDKVTVCIPDVVTMTAEMMRASERICQAAHLLRTLHSCGEDTDTVFDVFSLAEKYESVAARYAVSSFPDFDCVKDAVMGVRQEQLRHFSAQSVFCHNDPIYANWLLDKTGRLYLIDWEYAGMNDPMWDLADLSIESDFTHSHDMILLQSYLCREPDRQTMQRFLANKVYVDYLWSLWAKAREPFEDDWILEYGRVRYERMQQNLTAYQNLSISEST